MVSLHAKPAYLKERTTLHFNIASVSYEYRKCIAIVGTLSLLFPWAYQPQVRQHYKDLENQTVLKIQFFLDPGYHQKPLFMS